MGTARSTHRSQQFLCCPTAVTASDCTPARPGTPVAVKRRRVPSEAHVPGHHRAEPFPLHCIFISETFNCHERSPP